MYLLVFLFFLFLSYSRYVQLLCFKSMRKAAPRLLFSFLFFFSLFLLLLLSLFIFMCLPVLTFV